MTDRDGWSMRELRESVASARLDDDDDDMCKRAILYLSFRLFNVSVSLEILILILDLGDWDLD